jgi:hypothetical protein
VFNRAAERCQHPQIKGIIFPGLLQIIYLITIETQLETGDIIAEFQQRNYLKWMISLNEKTSDVILGFGES